MMMRQRGALPVFDRPSLDPHSTGMLARDGAAVAHQLSRPRKARELAEFRDDRHRRDLRNAAQRLERRDYRSHPRRSRLHRLVDCVLEACDPARGVLHLVQIVQQRGLLGQVVEVHPAS